MKIIQEVLAELFSMFWADAWMTMFTLVLVAVVAALVGYTTLNPVWAGAFLLVGCLVNVVAAAAREKRIRDNK
jgi:hypothetical protein